MRNIFAMQYAPIVFVLSTIVGAANIYVDGSKANGSGSEASPFSTIQNAANIAQAGDVVYVRAGTYLETVKPANSGTAGNPITFRNYPGDSVWVCGGDKVTGWTLDASSIYWAPCTWDMGAGLNQVVANGDLMIEARYPNISGKEEIVQVRNLNKMRSCEGVYGTNTVNFSDLTQAANYWNGGIFVGCLGNQWCLSTGIISASSPGKLTLSNITSEIGTASGGSYGWGGGQGFVMGVKAALDADKEWYLDAGAGRLYLRAPGGINPSGMTVYVKRRTQVFDLSSRNYVVIDGINSMMGVINMATATNCRLNNGRHLYSSSFWLVTNSWIPSGSGWTAVYVSGQNNSIEGCELGYNGAGIWLEGTGHTVRNCNIHDIYGGTFNGSCITFGCTRSGQHGGHLVERNTMGKTGRCAIFHVDANWPSTTTVLKSRILHNEMYDFMYLSADGGAMYGSRVNGSGTEVAYNWVHGEKGAYGRDAGLYHDNDCSDYLDHHNVIWDVACGLGWNNSANNHRAFNNTIWARNEAIWNNGGNGQQIANNLSNLSNFSGGTKNLTSTNSYFVGPGTKGLDFRLKANSPAIDYGSAITGITDGYVGAAPDAGAYEYGGVEWKAGQWSAETSTGATVAPGRRSVYIAAQQALVVYNIRGQRVTRLIGDLSMVRRNLITSAKGVLVTAPEKWNNGVAPSRIVVQ